jgi:hypothetical protein
MRLRTRRTCMADQDPRPEGVGILRAVSAAARAPDDVTPPARSLVRIGAKPAAQASTWSDWVLEPGLPLVRAWIISHQYLPVLGQRSDDLVNMAAISAGRFQSQIGRVRQDNPKGPPVSNPWLRGCHHECLRHRVTVPLPAPGRPLSVP